MATIYDVARRAKVSTTTVSKVLSNTPYVSSSTRERILEVMRELEYVPSLAARGLTGNRTYVLGLVIPYDPDFLFNDPYLLQIIQGVESVANENDYNLLLSVARNSDQRTAYARLLRTGYVDGAITVETFEGDKAAAQLQERGLPYVYVGYWSSNQPINSVHCDDYFGAFEAINHLLSLGHRRIGVVSGPEHFMSAIDERLRGTREALADYGLRLDPQLITYGDFTVDSGYRASQSLLEAPNRPTAIFAMNDRMAVGIMRRAHEYGLQIPHDLSVVGFDDVPLALTVEPPLTTVRQPGVELGRVATQKLFELINGPEKQFNSIVIPVELVVRGTTAAPCAVHN